MNDHLQYVELGFEAEPEAGWSLPPFIGVTLRGAFGLLLKQAVCQVAHGQCARCMLRRVCPYPLVFEGLAPDGRQIMRRYPNVPQPFVLIVPPPAPRIPPAPPDSPIPPDSSIPPVPPALGASASTTEPDGDTLRWGVRLFGPARTLWPYVVHVFQTAGEQGIGADRNRFRNLRVTDATTGIELDLHEGNRPDSEPRVGALPITCELPGPNEDPITTLRWRFHTPLKLNTERGELTPLSLILAGRRRFSLLTAFYADTDPDQTSDPADRVHLDEDDFQIESTDLHAFGFSRYSTRQRRSMPLSGLMGEMVVRGPWRLAGAWLDAAPWIHLGKSTSFGFGRVSWQTV